MPAPVADFSFAPQFGGAPLLVQFADQSQNVPTAWAWTLTGPYGQVLTSTQQNPQFSLGHGRWEVKLVATNADGSGEKVVPAAGPQGQLSGPWVTSVR